MRAKKTIFWLALLLQISQMHLSDFCRLIVHSFRWTVVLQCISLDRLCQLELTKQILKTSSLLQIANSANLSVQTSINHLTLRGMFSVLIQNKSSLSNRAQFVTKIRTRRLFKLRMGYITHPLNQVTFHWVQLTFQLLSSLVKSAVFNQTLQMKVWLPKHKKRFVWMIMNPVNSIVV